MTSPQKKHLVWFRSDLRVRDHAPLRAASHKGGAVGVVLLTPTTWKAHGWGERRVAWYQAHVSTLQTSLHELGIPLHVLEAGSFAQVPNILKTFCDTQHITAVHAYEEPEYNEQQRDQKTAQMLTSMGIPLHRYRDTLMPDLWEVTTLKGTPYGVFTPFSKNITHRIDALGVHAQQKPRAQTPPRSWPTIFSSDQAPVEALALPWVPGEAEAHKRLKRFLEHRLQDYDRARDCPAEDGTSALSPYFAVGALSVREAWLGTTGQRGEGVRTWRSELLWREFYRYVTHHNPHICKGFSYQRACDALPWDTKKTHLQAWKKGQTGVPFVDAAMRQLNTTGWMHNRARMVVAMFLSKNLNIDWREGEAYFMEQLLDGDFSANNGGWQWSASTGTDAAPYFRIMNPSEQGKRCDPGASYIQRYVIELREITSKACHEPGKHLSASALKKLGYPHTPCVDLKRSRAAAIERFKALKAFQPTNKKKEQT